MVKLEHVWQLPKEGEVFHIKFHDGDVFMVRRMESEGGMVRLYFYKGDVIGLYTPKDMINKCKFLRLEGD